jgi:hypothetical protein
MAGYDYPNERQNKQSLQSQPKLTRTERCYKPLPQHVIIKPPCAGAPRLVQSARSFEHCFWTILIRPGIPVEEKKQTIVITITTYEPPWFATAAKEAGAGAMMDAPFTVATMKKAVLGSLEARRHP